MTISEVIADLLELQRSLGDIKVTKPYDLCGNQRHKEVTYVLVGVDNKGNKVVELL